MRPWRHSAVFAAGVLAGCMAGGAPAPARGPGEPDPPRATAPPGGFAATLRTPLLIDRTDLRLGTTAHFARVPGVGELHDLTMLPALARVVLALPSWPDDYAPLEALNRAPPGVEIVVVLPGYPPSQRAADMWDHVGAPLRIVVVVPGPPPSPDAVLDLNSMRSLERVIAQMERPSRSGFERLQRPLSFRTIVD